jgi:hypothetical protein
MSLDQTELDQYFELALDLPERQREQMLSRLATEEPALAERLRGLLASPRGSGDFACSTGQCGQPAGERAVRDAIHHVALQVRDIGRAVDWYRSVLACELAHQDESWALLEFANLRVALVLPDEHPAHLAILRPDAARFGPLSEHRDGSRSAHIVDPWGNSIELLDPDSLPPDPNR